MEPKKSILVVDDDEQNRKLLGAMLDALGYGAVFARNGMEALEKVHEEIDVVLLDVTMPGMDGFEVARRIRMDPMAGDIPVVMVTAHTSQEDRLHAVEVGANDFIGKPFDITELRIRVAAQVKMKEAQNAIKRYQLDLEEKVEQRTLALRQALQEVVEAQQRTSEAHMDTIRRLALAAEYKDMHTAVHIQRMGCYCALIARKLGLPEQEIEIVLHAGPMHDVGKIGIPDAILLKPGKLTEQEREVMKQHTVIGARILGGSPSKFLQAGEIIALCHHEWWNGKGYPNRLSGEAIPLYARICAIADTYDALTMERPYKRAFTNAEAVEIMRAGRGNHFDPKLVDLFLENLDAFSAIREQYQICLPMEPHRDSRLSL